MPSIACIPTRSHCTIYQTSLCRTLANQLAIPYLFIKTLKACIDVINGYVVCLPTSLWRILLSFFRLTHALY